MPPTARSILQATRTLLEERGYRGLTFHAIAVKSGANQSMIRYYFGSKDGLIAALVDDLTHDASVELLQLAKNAKGEEDGLTSHLLSLRRLMEDPSFKNLFDVLPEAIRRRHLRESLASLYEWYREIEVECFRSFSPEGAPDLRVLATLHMAVIDGLALQLALNEEAVDLDACWGLVESMTVEYLSGRLRMAPKDPTWPKVDRTRDENGGLPTARLRLVSPSTGVPSVIASRPPLLETRGLTKSFEGLLALDSVDLSVTPGSIHGLIGPNGSGKTTFFNVVSGLLPPTGGQVLFASQDVTARPAHEITRLGLSRTFQGGKVFPKMTCLENVMCGMHSRTKADVIGTFLRVPFTSSRQERACIRRATDLLDLVGLADSARRWAADLVWIERQLLQVARALASEPQLILLDEPTSGMGAEETERVRDLVREIRDQGVTIVVVSHDVRFVASLAESITVLSYGEKICEGSPEQVQCDPQVLEVYLGAD